MNQLATQLTATIVFLCILAGTDRLQGEAVAVKLQSGREVHGQVHQRTDDGQLWLQYGTRGVTVIRPISWGSIAEATFRGESVTVDQLQRLATQWVANQPSEAVQPATTGTRVVRVTAAAGSEAGATMAQRVRQALGFARPTRAVQFDATIANWDADVETDGLLLTLYPLDGQGSITATGGTLHVEFIAARQRGFNDVPGRGGLTTGLIGRWTVQVDEADFGPQGATLKLPFQALHPEFDADWLPGGIVHVRFNVAGVGTFEHSQDGVRTRPWAPLRDAEQLRTGRRFFNSERTGRGQQNAD